MAESETDRLLLRWYRRLIIATLDRDERTDLLAFAAESGATGRACNMGGQPVASPVSLKRYGVFRNSPRSFHPIGIVAIAAIVLAGNMVGAILALLWARVTRTPWRDLGFVRPGHRTVDLFLGLVGGVVLYFVMKALVMPLLGVGGINTAYHYLSGNAAALPGALFTVIVGGGIGEEIVWRGFLFERLRSFLGNGRRAKLVILVATSILFGLAHFWDQGFRGFVQGTITGLAFGAAFMRMGSIWPVMVAHAAFDVTAVLMIYLEMEAPIGRLLLS